MSRKSNRMKSRASIASLQNRMLYNRCKEQEARIAKLEAELKRKVSLSITIDKEPHPSNRMYGIKVVFYPETFMRSFLGTGRCDLTAQAMYVGQSTGEKVGYALIDFMQKEMGLETQQRHGR